MKAYPEVTNGLHRDLVSVDQMQSSLTSAPALPIEGRLFDNRIDPETLLTYEQAASRLQTPVSTLQKLVHRREIPFCKVGKRNIRFYWPDLVDWFRTKG